MLLILLSLFFCWLLYREIKNPEPLDRFNLSYMAVLLGLALLSAWPPFKHWRFEQFLSAKAYTLADKQPVNVHCDTLFDAIFEVGINVAGYVYQGSRDVTIQYPWCKTLMDHLDRPENANHQGIFSVHLFTHEVMHARGEFNENIADCQAVQRYYRSAKLLGLDHDIAQRHAVAYYRGPYRHHPYFTAECVPGTPLDEYLVDSTWKFLPEPSR